jgi:hypothetical protein
VFVGFILVLLKILDIEKKLSSIVKTMKEKASLDPNKRLTNHSARKYLVEKLRTNNIEGKDIMQISGNQRVDLESWSGIVRGAR